jgi:small subunit ribosomal protein S8
MSLSDPIADMLVRIKNGQQAGLDSVGIPGSVIKGEIARVLKREGLIRDFAVEGNEKKRVIRVYLKYVKGDEPVLKGMKRISRPGARRYAGYKDIPKVLGGMGFVILSTPGGVVTDREARAKKLGGEILCTVW